MRPAHLAPLLCTLLLPLAPGLGRGPARPTQDELAPAAAELRTWYERWSGRRALWSGAEETFGSLVEAAVAEAGASGPALEADAAVLLDLLGWSGDTLDGSGARVRRRVEGALEGLLAGPAGGELARWLADEVLALRRRHPLERRRAALGLVDGHRTQHAKLALLTLCRDGDDPLRGEALEVLATWPDPAVDLFLVGLLGKPYDRARDRHPFNLVLQRTQSSAEPLGPRASALLRERLAVMLLSRDWREASRAIELARGLEPTDAVPLLLDALSAWHRREGQGRGSRRILNEVLGELRRISGKSIGTNPKNWITWWIAVRQGRAELAQEGVEPEVPRTAATFFGLRPLTDQVTFVIDISGSMSTEWGTAEHSRYVEAVEQMMRFLQAAGPQTRFNVILFSDAPLRSSPELVRATADNLARARASLLARHPRGNTLLRPAVELALRLDADGRVDPERLEADTIVVLCDGETAEGPRWVQPLLDRIQDDARVVFHCALIGTAGDGTLERLAAMTGGDFLRIGG